jgi:putative transposase
LPVEAASLSNQSEGKSNERNGHRARVLSTKAGDVELVLPSILDPPADRPGPLCPSHGGLCPWGGHAGRRLVAALGVSSGISRSEVSRMCVGLDEVVDSFRERCLDHVAFPYVYLDATFPHVRELHQVTSNAVVIATRVAAAGHREILGIDVGDSENETFCREFLRQLRARGFEGVQLVISDQPRKRLGLHPGSDLEIAADLMLVPLLPVIIGRQGSATDAPIDSLTSRRPSCDRSQQRHEALKGQAGCR